MTRFNDSNVEAALDAEHVDFCIAATFDFVSGVVRAHLGYGVININGNDFIGVGTPGTGGVGSISAISERPDARNFSQIQVGLSGVDPAFMTKVPNRTDYRGRYCAIYLFPLDPKTLQPVNPTEPPRAEGFIDFMSRERKQGTASISVTLNSFDSLFQKAIGLTYTDQSQKSLGPAFANDSFFDTVPLVQNTQIFWGGFPAPIGGKVSPPRPSPVPTPLP
jgi:hypothetical protein